MELRLYIKQSPQFDVSGNPAYYQGNTVNTLAQTAGTLPTPRQWRSYGNYLDATEDVTSDLNSISLSWTANADNEGFISPTTAQQTKGFTGSISLGGEAYSLIKKWLVEDVSAVFNSVDAMIVHYENGKECGRYFNYVIKSTEVRYCEGSFCYFDVNLKQKDEAYNCIRSTLIADNWQGWFQEIPLGGKKHPRFSYCNEQRPNGTMIMIWWISAIVSVPTLLVLIPIMIGLNGLFAVINVIIGIIKTIIAIVGGDDTDEVDWQTIEYFDFRAILDAYGAYFVESAGCGREHPAPLIRDYISNVCSKCGVKVDHLTAPVFFNEFLLVDPSEPDRGAGTVRNPHYNMCYFNAPVKRGIRRFASLNALRALPNNTNYYIPENRPLHTLDTFLDELKEAYNSAWYIRDNTLYFYRKDHFRAVNRPYALELSENGIDRGRIVEGICYELNENKIPAFTEGIYNTDAADTCGNEAKGYMNDNYAYGDASKVKVFDGKQDKTTQFGATRFRLDGITEDYIMDAMQVVVNSSFLTPFMAGIFFDFIYPSFTEYADYALLLSDETCTLPKLLCWDGERYQNARAVRPYSAWGVIEAGMPDINTYYNRAFQDWRSTHTVDTFVRGSGLTLPPNQPGYYLVTDFFGAREIKRPAMLVNYPAYTAIYYRDGLWDWFQWIDDPNRRGASVRTFRIKLELCCDLLNKLQIFGDGNSIVLGEKVSLPYGREGVITEIKVNYNPTETYGMSVEVTGNVYG